MEQVSIPKQPAAQLSADSKIASPIESQLSVIAPIKEPPVQHTSGKLQRMTNSRARQEVFRSIQRTFGNNYAARVAGNVFAGQIQRQSADAATVQRDEATAPKDIDKPVTELINYSGGSVQTEGSVKLTKKTDTVQVNGPEATFEASANIKDASLEIPKDKAISVGPVQTLMGSSRIGTYRKAGDPNGEVTSQRTMEVGQVRDAQSDSKGGKQADVRAPWYSNPLTLDQEKRSGDVKYFDHPGFEWERKVGDGILTEIKGKDSFMTALAAKKGSEGAVALNTTQWEIPWAMQVTDAPTQLGGMATGKSIAPILPPTLDGPIAMQVAQQWDSFRTQEGAMAASNQVLIGSLVAAKNHDHEVWLKIVAALRAKNPTFTINLNVQLAASGKGSADDLEVKISGHQAGPTNTYSLKSGDATTISFGFNDVFDPTAVDAGAKINIQVTNKGILWDDKPGSISYNYPFAAQTEPVTLKGNEKGIYTVTANVK
jgi:phage baseplate assembly protein gpV